MYKNHISQCGAPLQNVQCILSRVVFCWRLFLSCWRSSNLFIEQVKAVRSGLVSLRLMKTQIPLTPVNWLGGVKCLPTRPPRLTHTHTQLTHKVVSLQTAGTWHFDPLLLSFKDTHTAHTTHTRVRLLWGRGTAPSAWEPVAVTFKIDYKGKDWLW